MVVSCYDNVPARRVFPQRPPAASDLSSYMQREEQKFATTGRRAFRLSGPDFAAFCPKANLTQQRA